MNDNGITVNLAEARDIAERIWGHDRTHAFVWFGPSGVGKSAVVESMVKEGEGFFPIYGHAFNATESNGILYVNEKTGLAEFAKLGTLPLPKERGDPERGIICVEEPNLAPPSIQAELMKLIYARVSGSYKIPPGYGIIGCANRPKDKANVNPMPYPLRVRWTWMHVEADVDVWIDDFAIPKNLDWTIIAFLRFKRHAFQQDPPVDGPGACGRTWERVDDAIKAGLPGIMDKRTETEKLFKAAVCGMVGSGIGSEYMAYRQIASKLPDMTEVAYGRDPWLPDKTDPGLVSAVIASLESIYRQAAKKDKSLIEDTIYKFADYLSEEEGYILLSSCVKACKTSMIKHSRWKEYADNIYKYIK